MKLIIAVLNIVALFIGIASYFGISCLYIYCLMQCNISTEFFQWVTGCSVMLTLAVGVWAFAVENSNKDKKYCENIKHILLWIILTPISVSIALPVIFGGSFVIFSILVFVIKSFIIMVSFIIYH